MLPNLGKIERLLVTNINATVALAEAVQRLGDSVDATADLINRQNQEDRVQRAKRTPK